MLKAETSKYMKAFTLTNELLGLAVGILSLQHGISRVLEIDPEIAQNGIAFWSILGGLLAIVGSLWTLVDDWILGKVHTRYLANSTTLAILSGGGRVRFIKCKDCVALTRGGQSFAMADGTLQHLDFPIALGVGRRDLFLTQLFARWWPTTPYEDVKYFFHFHEDSRLGPYWLVGSVIYVVSVATGLYYSTSYGIGGIALVVVPAFIVAFIAITFSLHTRFLRARALRVELGS